MTRFAEAGRELRLQQKYNTAINDNGSVDCRRTTKPVTERVRVIKPVSRKANGQYTRETQVTPRFKLIIYPYDPSRIYRRDLKTGFEVPIVEKIDGEWFPCVILRPSEVQSLKSFPGAAGMDIDKAIANKPRCRVHSKKGTYQVGGKYVYRCAPVPGNLTQEERKEVKKQDKKDTKKQRSLIQSVDLRKNAGNTRRAK